MIEKVKLWDYSNYSPDGCSNGGNYGFSESYYYDSEKNCWEIVYGTTADFQYCPFCGSFMNDYSDDKCPCGEEPEYITGAKLAERIANYQRYAEAGEEYYITWIKDGVDNKPLCCMPDLSKEEIDELIKEVVKQ